MRVSPIVALGLVLGLVYPAAAQDQDLAPATAQSIAPTDLTGTFVSVVTESWRWRMVTPARGDYASVPLNEEGARVADGWDPERDALTGEACRSYGAAGIMRIPGRGRISWQDANTLRVELDAGTQTRLFHFGPEAAAMTPGEASWQGYSVAEWETEDGARDSDLTGSLRVVTTNMRPGYLRKNGVPYSVDAVLTEFWDINTAPNGDPWLVVTSIVEDPQFLQRTYVTSPNFKREADDSSWAPTECSTTW